MLRTARRMQRRLSLSWLMWLVLLVPVAQSMAAWHSVSHIASAASRQGDEPQLPHSACELCLAGAAVDAGAPITTPAMPVLLALRHAMAPAAIVAAWVSAPLAGYLSRAPPLALR
jgi:hypothetical protein